MFGSTLRKNILIIIWCTSLLSSSSCILYLGTSRVPDLVVVNLYITPI